MSLCNVTCVVHQDELYLQDQAFQEDRVAVRVLGDVCKFPPGFGQQILRKQW